MSSHSTEALLHSKFCPRDRFEYLEDVEAGLGPVPTAAVHVRVPGDVYEGKLDHVGLAAPIRTRAAHGLFH